MKSRAIPFLFVSLVLLSVAYYYDHQHIVARRTAEVQEGRVLPFPVEKLDTLEFRNAAGTFKLVKLEGVWRLMAPSSKVADQKMIEDNILKMLDAANRIGSMPLSDAERKTYGVEKDKALWVRASASHTDKGVPNSVEFLLGADTPIPDEIYFWDAADPARVRVTQQTLRRAFQYTEMDLRDKSVCEYDMEKAQAIDVSWDGVNSLRMQRNEAGGWNVLTAPKTGVSEGTWCPADKRLVDNLLNTLKSMRPFPAGAQRAIRGSQVESQEGKALVRVNLPADAATSGTKQVAMQLEIGLRAVPFDVDLSSGTLASKELKKRAPWIAEISGNDLLYEADSKLPGWLHNSPEAYRDRQVLGLNPEDVTGIHIAITIANKISDTVDLVREKAGSWQFAADKNKAVNQTNATIYLAYCLSQQIDTFQNDLPSTLSLPTVFQQPILRVQLTAGEKVQGYEIGKPVAQGDSRYYARRVEGPEAKPGEVFALNLPAQVLMQLLKLGTFFEDRPAVRFDPAAVASVVVGVVAGEEVTTITLQRSSTEKNAAWMGNLPGQKSNTIPPNVMQPFFETLRAVQYISINNNPDDATIQKSGLAKPIIRVYLYGQQGDLLASLVQGKNPENERDTVLVRDGAGRYLLVSGGAIINLNQALGAIGQRVL